MLAVGLVLTGSIAFSEITPEPLGDDVAAFYPLTGYENGTRWGGKEGTSLLDTTTEMANAVDGKNPVVSRCGPHGYVTVTNETPGKYLFASMDSTVPMATSYMSMRAVGDGALSTETFGSWIEIPGFANEIARAAEGTGGCTLEFFVKPHSDSYSLCCWFDMGSGTKGRPLLALPVNTSGDNARTISFTHNVGEWSVITLPADVRDSKWHHVALVYEQPDPTKDGKFRLFFDYQAAAATITVPRDPNLANAVIRFGNCGNNKNNWPGLYSAIRLSKKALKQNEMMVASDELRFTPEPLGDSVAAFYPLTGYANGTRWGGTAGGAASSLLYTTTEMANAVNGLNPVVACCGPHGYVTVTNETPGKYLFSSVDSTVPMAMSYMSLRAAGEEVQAGETFGSWIEISGFSYEIARAAEGTGGCTLEFFVKPRSDCFSNCCWFDMGKEASGESVTTVRLQLQLNDTDAKTVQLFDYYGYSKVTAPADVRDSKWHHVALVYEQPDSTKDGTIRLYFDYQAAADAIKVKRNLNAPNALIRLGNCGNNKDNWQGLFSAIRLSKKALKRNEMMRASDKIDGADATIGFYPLDDQPAGTVFNVANRTSYTSGNGLSWWDGFYANQAATRVYTTSGSSLRLAVQSGLDVPGENMYVTNDVPGRYVYSGVAAASPLHELKSSICQLQSTAVGNKQAFIATDTTSADLVASEAYTIEFFTKFLSAPNYFCFFDLGSGSNYRIILYPQANGMYAQHAAGSKSTAVYPDLTSLVDGKWHHVAMVDDGTEFRLYCDYTQVGNAMSAPRGTGSSGCRIALGNHKALYSSWRMTERALAPQEFLYASDSADGVLADANWNWRLEGGRGTSVTSATSVGEALDADQYLFKDAHGFTGGATSGGSLLYDLSLLGNVRLIGGVRDGRNRTSATAAGAYLASGLTGPLCAPGLAFTAEALVQATAPAEGAATVFGAENLSGDPVWNLALDDSGALVLNYALLGGPVVTRKVMDGFAGAAHHVALVADLESRLFKVYVDYAEKLADDSAPGLLAKDGLRFVAAGGCGQSVLTGSVDEIRLTHGLLAPSAFEAFERSGFLLQVW